MKLGKVRVIWDNGHIFKRLEVIESMQSYNL
jgi:hypothetical protein